MALTSTRSPSELGDHLGYWLRSVSNHVSHAFAGRLTDHDVTVAEWVILREMFARPAGIAPSLISAWTGLTRGAVSKLVDRLERKKLLARAGAAHDRRYQELRLTPAARSLVPRLAREADANDAACFAPLSATERRTLRALLEKLATAHALTRSPVE